MTSLTLGLTARASSSFPLIPKPFPSHSSSPSSLSFPIHHHGRHIQSGGAVKCPSSSSSSRSPGLYSLETFELTAQNVDLVLEDVRPYLIADGGNVEVVGVEEDGVVSLRLQDIERCLCDFFHLSTIYGGYKQYIAYSLAICDFRTKNQIGGRFKQNGACGTCPSSTTTMKMGIERALKEKFGEAIKEIRQVYNEVEDKPSVEAVNRHLDILRPAIANYGGSVEVLSMDGGGDCHVRYIGPESIGNGIKAAIKEKFPDIVNVEFTG